MNLILTVKIELAAVKVLKKYFKFGEILKIVKKMKKSEKQGEPYKNFLPPRDQKDRDSRALIKDALLLYKELLEIFEQPKAEEIIRKVIFECAMTQLNFLIPPLKKKKLLKMNQEKRSETYCKIVDKFPNTDWELSKDSLKEVQIKINGCRLKEIFIEAGYPELKDACCQADLAYFVKYQKDLIFKRDLMLGHDDPYCDFNFQIKE